MRTKLSLLITMALFTIGTIAQNGKSLQKAILIQKAEFVKVIPSIASQIATGDFIPSDDINKEVNPKRVNANRPVPGKGLPVGNDPLWQKQLKATKIKGKEPILTFEAASANTTPTDPTGAVGPNHFINAWNSSFRIWDKEGNPLTPAAALGTILNGNAGDPIVFYDQFADRFIITEFYSNGFGMAVCQGTDPVNNGWYLYQFDTDVFPDYPKFSLWSDGYYITANKNSGTAGTSEVVFAVDRQKMLVGDPSAVMIGFPLPGITTSGFYSPLGFNVNGDTPPPPGDAPIVYMQDDAWSGVSTDHLKIWNINVDWNTPANSTISDPQIIETAPFDGLFDGGSFSNLPQPSGPDIDALQATIMFMAQYRRFSGYNSVVFNFVVDLDGNDDYAGIRWYELRQNNDGDPWEIYQEGTYSQPDGHSAFSGNMCMDINGNIGLAYTTVSTTQYPSLRFTGRFANDPLGTMTIEEESFAEGTASDPSNRYGDYAQMTIDPVDGKTFWSIGEYFNGGPRKNQVGVFKIASDLANDVGVISIDAPTNGTLSASEEITVTIRNFGTDEQTGIPVSFRINGGSVVSEVFSGTLSGNENQQYTFTATGDFSNVGETYTIEAFTSLSNDENNLNDTISGEVTYLFPDDLGISAVISPVSGTNLGDDEIITVTIENFGGEPQSGFDVFYILDGADPVTETVTGTVNGSETLDYSFAATADFSLLGEYSLSVATSLSGDYNTSNDTINTIIIHEMCQPSSDCSFGDGVQELILAEITNNSGCDPDGYGDYTGLTATLEQGSSNDLTITTGYGSQHIRVWIDFNDNFVFEPEEIIISDFEIANGQGAGTYTETTNLDIPEDAAPGEHLFRIKTNWNAPVPDDPCEPSTYGETEDYTVNVVLQTGIAENIESDEMIIYTIENNHFVVTLETVTFNEPLILTVHNIQGRTLINNRVENVNGKYVYDIDLSYAKPGIYLVRLGSDSFGKIKKIVVR